MKPIVFASAAAALGLSLLASAASADPYGYPYGNDYAFDGSRETVIVTAPPYRQERDYATGAPIVQIAASRRIAADDVDLRTRWGAHMFRARVRATAQSLCHQLDMQYATIDSNSRDCYLRAVDDGMAQADDAIARARSARF